MAKGRPSLLYLQMGQEVIYILLACATLASILLVSIVVHSRVQDRETQQKLDDFTRRNSSWIEIQDKLQKEKDAAIKGAKEKDKLIGNINREKAEVESERDKLKNDKPPIILLTEREGYTFATGSADILPAFRERVSNNIVPNLKEYAGRYSASIIEIIGHTDEVQIGEGQRSASNIDKVILDVVNNKGEHKKLIPHDNVGLGMARAASVRQLLIDLGLGQEFTILPLSAGPLITVDENITSGSAKATGEEARRRIEIRLRRKSRDTGQWSAMTTKADSR